MFKKLSKTTKTVYYCGLESSNIGFVFGKLKATHLIGISLYSHYSSWEMEVDVDQIVNDRFRFHKNVENIMQVVHKLGKIKKVVMDDLSYELHIVFEYNKKKKYLDYYLYRDLYSYIPSKESDLIICEGIQFNRKKLQKGAKQYWKDKPIIWSIEKVKFEKKFKVKN